MQHHEQQQQQHIRYNMVRIPLALIAALVLMSATAVVLVECDVHTYSFGPFTGGRDNCALCGEPGQYQCVDANKTMNQVFVDRLFSPYTIVTKVEVSLRGSYGCSQAQPNVIEVTLNGVSVNVLDAAADQDGCACNTCGGDLLFTTEAPLGFPKYQYGENTFQVIGYSGSFCLNTIQVSVTYKKQYDALAVMYQEFNVGSTDSVGPEAVCGRNLYVRYSAVGILDPLPAGSLVQTIAVQLFGKFFAVPVPPFNTKCMPQANGTVFVNSRPLTPKNQVYSRIMESNVFSGCSIGCDGIWTFTNSQYFANGFPTYYYGATNSFSWDIAGPSDVSRVAVWLYYTSPAVAMDTTGPTDVSMAL
eukprot:TRINITY_DN360_c0_g1_i1.p1 TRINITY_DN360_c0_g1~~TRINITY_DN360_c0_g1_i1.p1  ORF type:complete len:359 (-),score=37.58 TRINITY_DN360_c0_g1_i1:131-1207(-)